MINFSGTQLLEETLQSFKEHKKHVIDCRWSKDGMYYATASHDKSVVIYKIDSDLSTSEKNTVYFTNTVEAIEFSAGEDLELIVAMRECASLVYINCATLDQRKVSINDADWDTHVSFTIMHLQRSPDDKYLLAATDKSRLIVYEVGSNRHLRLFYGHTADEYFNPRAVWHQSGKYILANSQTNHEICVWCVASQNIVHRLQGHSKLVRDISHHQTENMLLTASYDGSVKIWKHVEEEVESVDITEVNVESL
mmetsp:Transcript_32531/g.41702  ORF Transcript_32531/g.41702 Transcript_32531/m.41702 type:complete len:252 (+) Transcript_32531:2-757(+)